MMGEKVETAELYGMLFDPVGAALAVARERDELRVRVAELEAVNAVPCEVTEGDLPESLRRRLMPEGMEWPRFEDGEPVRFGDDVVTLGGSAKTVYGVLFEPAPWGVQFVFDGEPDERVSAPVKRLKRPSAPDAESVSKPKENADSFNPDANGTKPDANGTCPNKEPVAPDSWERMRGDIAEAVGYQDAKDYCEARGIKGYGVHDSFCWYAMADDVIRRAKALAGGGDE